MSDVSIPCEKCRAAVRFGESSCRSCGAPLSRDARDALHERLLATNGDYRELQEHVSAARTVLLILALLYVAYGVLGILLHSRALAVTSEGASAARMAFFENAAAAAMLFGCWWAARSAPIVAVLVGTLAWLCLQLLGALVFSVSAFVALWFKAVVAILLTRGVVAGFRAHRLLRKMRAAA